MKLLALLMMGLISACAGAGSVTQPGSSATTSPATLAIAPATFAFSLDQNNPQQVSVTRSTGIFSSLDVAIADPTVVGVVGSTVTGSSATFQVIPIARGTTTISATDQSGNTAGMSVATAQCGRPPSLLAAQPLAPSGGATGVSPNIGTLYFVAYVQRGTALSGNLHLAVGQHHTLEGGALVAATPPPGIALPTPIPLPNAIGIVARASVPTLAQGQTYTTQLYNDTCQPAVIAGTFST